MFISSKERAKSDLNNIELYYKSKFVSSNTKAFKAMVAYISKLRENGVLSDKEYQILLNHACTLFIEKEVKTRVEDVLEQKITKNISKIDRSLSRVEDSSRLFMDLR